MSKNKKIKQNVKHNMKWTQTEVIYRNLDHYLDCNFIDGYFSLLFHFILVITSLHQSNIFLNLV